MEKNLLKFNEDFIRNYDEDSDKSSKLVCNLYDKNNYVVHIRSLKQALDHGLILKKVIRVIQFSQKHG